MIPINASLKQHIPIGISIIIGIMVLFMTIYSLHQWHVDWIIAHDRSAEHIPVTTKDETADMIAAIPEEHLFGQSFSQGGAVPITNLQLSVTGIVKVDTENNGSVSKVYISMAGAPSKIYQAGDSLPYGVKVYEITDDTVILENDGHLEKLPLPRERLQFKPRMNVEVQQ